MKQALLVIDLQRDYFEGGKFPLVESDEALKVVCMLADSFRTQGLPVIFIQHIKPSSDANFFGKGTVGAELHPKLTVADSPVIEKHFPNSFLETDLQETLKNLSVDQLVITGMMTHMCVDSTTRQAAESGYQPIVISDGTATRDLAFNGQVVSASHVQLSFLSALTNFAKIQTSHEFLESW